VPGGPSASAGGSAVAATQTDTEWGRIWDKLPPSFPRFPTEVPTETGEGPYSAEVAIDQPVDLVSQFIQDNMYQRGFTFESVEGPAEDGGVTLNAVGPGDGCAAQVRIKPLGGSTVMSILYGASCPFE
jgi:hypothetical protein